MPNMRVGSHAYFLRLAIAEARAGMEKGDGGPFGAVIVRDGRIIGKGHNTVLSSHDPTAHAEVNAIRNACEGIGHHELSGAVIYSNFEPCPMCLAAIYWAHIDTLYYSAGKEDAALAGFMDKQLYEEMKLPPGARRIPSSRIAVEDMDQLMRDWKDMEGKILY
jgi:tRNA(Arg) A34 adenosine deaminase TadA